MKRNDIDEDLRSSPWKYPVRVAAILILFTGVAMVLTNNYPIVGGAIVGGIWMITN